VGQTHGCWFVTDLPRWKLHVDQYKEKFFGAYRTKCKNWEQISVEGADLYAFLCTSVLKNVCY
jgi:hypothetical protein